MKRLLFTLLLIMVIVAVSVGYYLWPNHQKVVLYDTNKVNFVIGGEIIQEKDMPIIEQGEILLSLTAVKEHIDDRVLWDAKNNSVIITTADRVIKMKTDQLTAMVNARPIDLNIPVRLINEVPYIPVQFLSEFFDIDLKWIETTNVVIMDYKRSYKRLAEVIEVDAVIRLEPNIKAPILVDGLEIGQTMRAFDEYEKWYKVRMDDGVLGYIQKRYIKTFSEDVRGRSDVRITPLPWRPEVGKINLVWEYVHRTTPDMSREKKIEGLDVVSPTWFSVIDKQGTVANKADAKYVAWAHKNGYKVWALVNNSFDPDITHEVINDSNLRERGC